VPRVVPHQNLGVFHDGVATNRDAIATERPESPCAPATEERSRASRGAVTAADATPRARGAVAAADATPRARAFLHPRHRSARPERGRSEQSKSRLEREEKPGASDEMDGPRGKRAGRHGDGVVELVGEFTRQSRVFPRRRRRR